MKTSLIPLFLMLGALAGSAPSVQAGIVLDWNTEALDAVQTSGSTAPEAARNLAILQSAIYDSVFSIEGTHNPLFTTGAGPSGASLDAAAAAAANTVLGALYPALNGTFSTLYNDQLAAIPNSSAKTDGINWGTTVATQILNWRSVDGASSAGSTPYTPSGQLGGWAPTPHSVPSLNYLNPPQLPGWGSVTPFLMTSGSQFRPVPWGGASPQTYLTTAGYAADYNQVKDLGAKLGSTRTSDQTASAYFWYDRVGGTTTVGQWNQIAKNLLGTSSGIVQESLVMAALNVSLADASIAAYDAKYTYDFWRPLIGIAYGDIDGNAATIGDSLAGIPGVGWESLLDNPPSPTMVSANGAFAGAAVTALKNFFGDVATSAQGDTNGDGIIDGTRSWGSLTAAGQEASFSGVLGGYEYQSDTQLGQALGATTATNALGSFALVPEPTSLLLVTSSIGLMLRRRRMRQA